MYKKLSLCLSFLVVLYLANTLVKHSAKGSQSDVPPKDKLTKKLHIGIIMDGNRRWAKKLGKLSVNGHRAGAETAEQIIKYANEIGVDQLTLYTLSIENLQRSQIELDALFKLAKEAFEKWSNEIGSKNVKITFFGNRELFPETLKPIIKSIEKKTSKNTGMKLNILFCYGGVDEIVAAAKELALKASKKEISPEKIDKTVFIGSCQTASIGSPDIIIRTGGHKRLSNFMALGAIYSEIIFLDKFWPDFTSKDLDLCIIQFAKSERNFGK